MLVITDLFLQQ